MLINRQNGSSLIESLVALSILLFAILGLIGLQTNVLRLSSQSQYRLQASLLGQNIAGMIAVDSANVGCYGLVSTSALGCGSATVSAQVQNWRQEVLATLPNAVEPDIAIAADKTATVKLAWKSPKDPATRNLLIVVQPQ